MRTAGHRPGDDLRPALAAALALHLGLLTLVWRPARAPSFGEAVPITIVAHDPNTKAPAAVQAPVAQTAQTETPVPRAAAPEPPPPPPPPEPSRPKPKAPVTPAPQPRPTPAPMARAPKVEPAKPRKPAPPADTFSLDSLQADVAKSLAKTKPHPSFAARGPTRAETATVARVGAGSGVAQNDVAGLSQLLTRLWNVNCNADEAVIIPIKFSVGDDGRIVGKVDARNLDDSARRVGVIGRPPRDRRRPQGRALWPGLPQQQFHRQLRRQKGLRQWLDIPAPSPAPRSAASPRRWSRGS